MRVLSPKYELENIEAELEFSGLKPGTKKFEAALLAKRVTLCQEMRGLSSCSDCDASIACTLAETHARNARYGVVEEADEQSGDPSRLPRS
jgi:hypothetical protein